MSLSECVCGGWEKKLCGRWQRHCCNAGQRISADGGGNVTYQVRIWGDSGDFLSAVIEVVGGSGRRCGGVRATWRCSPQQSWVADRRWLGSEGAKSAEDIVAQKKDVGVRRWSGSEVAGEDAARKKEGLHIPTRAIGGSFSKTLMSNRSHGGLNA
jgi:hypothetical protein